MVDIFKDKTDKRDKLIAHLERLKDHIGWKIIVKALEENVRETEAKLHGDIEWDKDDTLKELQGKRNDRVRLRDLPDDLIKGYEKAEEFPPSLDPYS